MSRRSSYSTIYPYKGKYFAKLTIRLPDGKEQSITRTARNKTHAKQILDQLEEQYAEGGAAAIKGEKMTVKELAELFKKKKVFPAIYRGEKKVAGYKHPNKERQRINYLVSYWSDRLIRDITYSDIETYKLHLIQKETRYEKERSMHDTNAYLRCLRKLLNYAIQNRWLRNNPFAFGDPLINEADELPRKRPEQPGELDKLLAECVGQRAHLRILILLGMDTALRPAEMLRLKIGSIDLDEPTLIAKAMTTKTNRERFVPRTERLADALRAWLDGGLHEWLELLPRFAHVDIDELLANPETTIFANIKSVKTAWATALENAKLENLQIKDLRHWSTTNMVAAAAASGLPKEQVMKITGHTQERTFRRYIETDQAIVQEIGAALETFRKVQEEKAKEKAKEQEQPANEFIN